MVRRWQHPLADMDLVGSPIKLGATPVRTDLPPPLLGQHTQEVLAEMGVDASRFEALRAAGVV
ncbi:hypothetical protein D9M68_932960 [compost metagenome]